MLQTVESVVDVNGDVRLLEEMQLPSPRVLVTILDEDVAALDEITLLNEATLAENWNRLEEDAAWEFLQSDR